MAPESHERENTPPPVDEQYKAIVKKILREGQPKTDPQGVGNIAIMGPELVYDLSDGTIPLVTLRDLRGSWKAIVGELLWIRDGSTNVKDLHERGVHIWDKWAEATRETFHYPEGELGPTYGAQWRGFGSDHTDQLVEVDRLLTENPNSRRIVISAWNPTDINKVFVSPCIRYLQFFHAQNELSLTVVQGSADVPIGVPFDTVEYSLLLLMTAKIHGMQPKILKHILVDAHIYNNQIPAMQEIVERPSGRQPQLTITRDTTSIFDFEFGDFELTDYNPQAKMKIPAAL